MTGKKLSNSSDGIWDDGEWISWDYINEQLEEQDLLAEYPGGSIELIRTFEDLIAVATAYKDLTGRYLQIWGELGEFYAEVKYGIKRHRAHAPGSDGRLGNDFIEVKTISPEKGSSPVLVKRAGNFSKLIVVKISKDWQFESRIIDRKRISKGSGKHAKVRWNSYDEPAEPHPPS
ncbi:hypothetical protein BZL41_26370 [Pseudomonas sp. PIC25]|nr:hypothetical protein BZL41_26370 [Pseudomonas sp. PIC25]